VLQQSLERWPIFYIILKQTWAKGEKDDTYQILLHSQLYLEVSFLEKEYLI